MQESRPVPEDPSEEWYCSDECAQNQTSQFCLCAKNTGEGKMECHSAAACKGQRYYHPSCMEDADGDLDIESE